MKNNQNEIHYIQPLTKQLRSDINSSIDIKLSELNKCDETPYVNLFKQVYGLQKAFFNALPDGYPVPMIKKG